MTPAAARIRRGLRRVRTRLWPPALVLMYHRVTAVDRDPWGLAVTPAHFAEHLDVLRRHGRRLTCGELTRVLATGRVPRGAVVVTFDDGYADNLLEARPLLERHETPATVFAAAAYLGRPEGFWWDQLEYLVLAPIAVPRHLRIEVRGQVLEHDLGADCLYPAAAQQKYAGWRADTGCPTGRHRLFLTLYRLIQPLRDAERRRTLADLRGWAGAPASTSEIPRPLTVPELQALAGDRLVEIGAHTLTHPRLSSLDQDGQRSEIRGSRAALQEAVGRDVVTFAYPYGGQSDYTPETVALVREAGFSGACATIQGAVRKAANRFELPRFQVEDCDGDGFGRRLAEWTGTGA